jgi:hypothetical protein
VYTFGSAVPGSQALVLTCLVGLFGALHHAAAPMRSPVAQSLQTLLLLCLLLYALGGMPSAETAGQGVPVGAGTPDSSHLASGTAAGRLGTRLQVVFGVAVPLGASLVALVLSCARRGPAVQAA